MGHELEGRVAIVTGAASGIGRAIAVHLADAGGQIVAADVRRQPREGGAGVVEEIESRGGSVQFISADVSRWDEVDAVVGETVRLHDRLDILVNNAAVSADRSLVQTTEEDWERVMAVNLTGYFFCCKRAVQQMLHQQPRGEVRGRIVNISSQHGMIAAPGNLAYGVSKAAVVYMTRQIAVDYAEQGIICNAVAPGRILTGKEIPEDGPDPLDYAERRTPLPRLGRPEDVARAVTFLASDDASFITGENLMVDGGWMAG